MLPRMAPVNIAKHITEQFGGYDLRPGGGAVDMLNMSSDKYPLMTVRQPRSSTAVTAVSSYGAYDKAFYVDGVDFVYDGVVRGSVTAGKKQIAALNDNIVILPDNKYYDTVADTFGSLKLSWTGSISFADGTLYGEPASANTIETSGVAFAFSPGDAVTISGCTTYTENNQTSIIREISDDKKKLYFYENIFTVGAEAGTVTLLRDVPDMEFICECGNRLWGCKGDTIYASALGDINNWNKFDGVATDSWSVDVGSAGSFTGCCSYLGYPIFFKEEVIYKIFGSKPSNFTAEESARMGVAAGSDKSLAVAGEVLFYLSRAGVMAYTGGIPENISAPFGDVRYHNAVGGSDGIKYYISMQDTSNAWHLFVFDPRYNMWHREDATHAVGFGWQGKFYIAVSSGLWCTSAGAGTAEASVLWEYETGDLYENDTNRKAVGKILIRTELSQGAELEIEIKYDNGEWKTISTITAAAKTSYYLPLIPRRCDAYRLRLSGRGECTLHSIAKEAIHGSPLR